MANVDQNIERLIVRQLDGAIRADEELALNRELIRNPDARRLRDDYVDMDRLAGEALRELLGRAPDTVAVAELSDRRTEPQRAPHIRRGWWLVPGAVAAAILGLAVARYPLTLSDHDTARPAGLNVDRAVPLVSEASRSEGPMRNVGTHGLNRNIRRDLGRDVIGVMGEDGNIYWIEVDRTRTVTWPPSDAPYATREVM